MYKICDNQAEGTWRVCGRAIEVFSFQTFEVSFGAEEGSGVLTDCRPNMQQAGLATK